MKQQIKKILYFLKKVLPESFYRIFYEVSFRLYKLLLRSWYFRFIIYYKIKEDNKNLKKTKMIHKVVPYSLVGLAGLSQTYDLVAEIINNNLRGDIVECGVAQGGCSALMALKAFENNRKDRNIWFFDSFEGLPEPSARDFKNGNRQKKHKDDKRMVPKYFARI
ncbi:TylF/MycF family methyltransferase [bacterium]|nr:TylF/MycF family methyltransferase [bacterium]MBU4510224.1 TylF/MycF family methyltransferase [bacterium]